MIEYLVVVGHPKQFKYRGPLMNSTPRMRMVPSLVMTTGRWATFKAMVCIYDSAKAAGRNLLRSCRCQAFRTGTSISLPRWRASCVTGRAGEERKETRMHFFSLIFWR